MQKFTTKQFAENLGVSTDLIRYYREKGILTPEKDEHNQYNYYSFRQTRLIYETIKYRNIGFSNKEIVDILHHDSIQTIQKKINKKKDELIMKKEEMDFHISYLDHINQFLSMKHNEWYIIKNEAMLFLPHTARNNNFILDNGDLLKNWINNFPVTEPATLFKAEIDENNALNNQQIGHGFIAYKSNVDKFNLPLYEHMIEIPESRCILISLKRKIHPDYYYFENITSGIACEDNVKETIREIVIHHHFIINGSITLIFKGYDRQGDDLYQHFMLLVQIQS